VEVDVDSLAQPAKYDVSARISEKLGGFAGELQARFLNSIATPHELNAAFSSRIVSIHIPEPCESNSSLLILHLSAATAIMDFSDAL
jgi:hypothetical protein